jgi:HlyD family secretion protein
MTPHDPIAALSPTGAPRAPFGWLALARRHAGKALLLVAATVLAVLLGPRWLQGPQVQVDPVVQREFVQSVVASGRVETPHRVDLGAQITGTVLRVPVAEGQAVAAGTVLIELEATEQRATVRQAELAVLQARARLRQLRELQAPLAEQSLGQARANHALARQALQRNRELLAQGFIGQAALDESLRAEQVAAAQLRSAEQQLAAAGPDGSDTALAEAALAQAQAGVEAALARLRYASIVAPVAGTLITRNVEPGDVVQPGKVLMVLSPTSPTGDTQLVVQIDEKNLRLLKLGQPALASADAFPAQRFPAELVYINPSVDAQRGAIEVKLRVASPPATLRQDMTVSIDIEVARRAGAVLVPVDALRQADTATPWVLKVDGGHARRQAVRLGLRSGGVAEVLDGLRPGDVVVPAATVPAVVDGQRIRALAREARP